MEIGKLSHVAWSCCHECDENKEKKKKFSHTDKNYFLSSFLIRFMVQVVMEREKSFTEKSFRVYENRFSSEEKKVQVLNSIKF